MKLGTDSLIDEFRHFAQVPRSCTDPLYCFAMDEEVAQIGVSNTQLAIVSSSFSSESNKQMSSVVQYLVSPYLSETKNLEPYNLKGTEISHRVEC
mmetsp:Transcript_12329/g.15324  ORF Transcript_12329/g.15324 Transcript_12329/m.15324 type:complete len:95 (-) Transcript_12329:378-662(-)